MKLKVRESQVIHTTGNEFEGGGIGIDSENMGMAMKMFSQYSDVISSIVREITSNGVDANIEAKMIPSATDKQLTKWHYTGDLDVVREYFSNWKERNVLVTVREGNPLTGSTRQFEVQDWGVGMSPKRMDKIFRKFFSSTKRDTNKLIGAYGLGSKSPLGYCDLFSVTTVYFGVEYEYAVHAGTVAPELKLINKCKTSEINGTTFLIPIKDDRDLDLFQKAVCKQLMYFDGLVIEGVSEYSLNPIIRGQHFVFREGSANALHLCLGKVYYPINAAHFNELNYNLTRLSIGLHFEIGEIDIVWNRESIEYTTETIDAIKEKIIAVKEELQRLWDSDYSDLNTIEKLISAADQVNKESLIVDRISIPNTHNWINRNVRYASRPKMGKFRNAQFLSLAISVDRIVKLGKTKQVGKFTTIDLIDKKVYLWDPQNQNSDPFVNEYLYVENSLDEFYLVSLVDQEKAARLMVSQCIQFEKEDTRASYISSYGSSYINFEDGDLKLQKAWIDFMGEVMDYVKNLLPEYDRNIVPNEWVEAKKTSKKAKARATKIAKATGKTLEVKDKKIPTSSSMPYKHLQSRSDWNSYNTSWTMCTVDFAHMDRSVLGRWLDHSRPVIYGTQDNRNGMIDLYTFIKGDQAFDYCLARNRGSYGSPLFILIAKENLKILDLFPTAFTLLEYTSRMGNMLIKTKTAKLIEESVENLIDANGTAMGQVSGYKKLYNSLHNYCNSHAHSSEGNFYNLCKESTPLDMDIIHMLWKAIAIERRFPMLAHVLQFNGNFPDTVSAEFDKYFRDKGHASPELHKRLAEKKKKIAKNKAELEKKHEVIANIVGSLNPQI